MRLFCNNFEDVKLLSNEKLLHFFFAGRSLTDNPSHSLKKPIIIINVCMTLFLRTNFQVACNTISSTWIHNSTLQFEVINN